MSPITQTTARTDRAEHAVATSATSCPVCGHVGATVVDAKTVRCDGRVHEPDVSGWVRCLVEYRVA